MSLTFEDVVIKLKQIDEVSLLEVLQISSEDIVDRFEDRIESRYDYLIDELQDEDQTT